jgi:superfamily I DNA/RNA helicase
LVLAEVRRLLSQGVLARQIALIGPSAHDKGALQGQSEVAGIPLTTDAAEWRRGGGILVTTARSFKGLEADVVVLYGLASFGPAFTLTDLYVAWTRAKHRLVAVCHGEEVRTAIEVALADSKPTGRP